VLQVNLWGPAGKAAAATWLLACVAKAMVSRPQLHSIVIALPLVDNGGVPASLGLG
jgi:hypothetical protein